METEFEDQDDLGVEEMLDDLIDEVTHQAERRDDGAPIYAIPLRAIGAIEIPAIVANLDRAEKALGRTSLDWTELLDPKMEAIPFSLDINNPFARPVLSHNAVTNNVLLKVIVPKRTGRKRKRGADGPWEGEVDMVDADAASRQTTKVCSIARLDDPRALRRKLQDNVDKYKVEAVGSIRHTHRYRGMADFHWTLQSSDFLSRFMDQVYSGDVATMKDFVFSTEVDEGPNVDVIPPPHFTHQTLPFNYFYNQNPYVKAEYDPQSKGVRVTNTQIPDYHGHFIAADENPLPTGPKQAPDPTDLEMAAAVDALRAVLEQRPIWTRRSIANQVTRQIRSYNTLRKALNYVTYSFKGGPWRDAVIRYGVDPRRDPKYREYQTLMFKLKSRYARQAGDNWKRIRREQYMAKDLAPDDLRSHIFDGKTYRPDGKIWQVCDITDPVLARLFQESAVRPTCSKLSGWYHLGAWSKAKAIMKHKLTAIQFGRQFTEADYRRAMSMGDMTPPRTNLSVYVPLPDMKYTEQEYRDIYGSKPRPKRKRERFTQFALKRVANVDLPDFPLSRQATPSGDPATPKDAVEEDLLSLAGRSIDSEEENGNRDDEEEVDDEDEDEDEDEAAEARRLRGDAEGYAYDERELGYISETGSGSPDLDEEDEVSDDGLQEYDDDEWPGHEDDDGEKRLVGAGKVEEEDEVDEVEDAVDIHEGEGYGHEEGDDDQAGYYDDSDEGPSHRS